MNSLFLNNSGGAGGGTYYKPSTISCSYCKLAGNLFANNQSGADIVISSGRQDANIISNNVFIRSNGQSINSNRGETSTDGATIYNNIIDFRTVAIPSINILRKGNINFTSLEDLKLDTNYKPLEGSPVIDAGLNDASLFTLPDTDKDNNARVAGSQVDIGPYEFGSSPLIPVIKSFTASSYPTQLNDVTFTLDYSLTEGKTLTSLEFDAGDDKGFTTITLNENKAFTHNFTEAGKKTVSVRITDDAGKTVSSSLTLNIKALTAAQIIQKVRSNMQAECNNLTENCIINLDEIKRTARSSCALDPEGCNISLDGYRREGRNQCIKDPKSCGIATAKFDFTKLPGLSSGWTLSGTSEAITDMSQFTGVKLVWGFVDGTWKAYSPDTAISQKLANKGIGVLTGLPANAGFWIKK